MPLFSTPEAGSGYLLAIDPSAIELLELSQLIWEELKAAVGELDHPWSHVALATANDSEIFQRLLILRDVDAQRATWMLHTDARSPKVDQLRHRIDASGIVYAPSARVQLTVRGHAVLHTDDDLCAAQWQQTPQERFKNYLGVFTPGTSAAGPSTNLPPELLETGLTPELCRIARSQFAVIELLVDEMDLLFLRPSGNLRVRFRCDSGVCTARWIEP